MDKFYVCEEMQKLRDELDKRGIEWTDLSEKDGEWWMCRTHFDINGNLVSCINGYGSHGGYDYMWRKNAGLIECYSSLTDNVPIGWLTAQEVIEIVLGE